MEVELTNGKTVRFLNSPRGLVNAAFDFNAGDLKRHGGYMLGAQVYASATQFNWAVSDELLTVKELREAERLLQEALRVPAPFTPRSR